MMLELRRLEEVAQASSSCSCSLVKPSGSQKHEADPSPPYCFNKSTVGRVSGSEKESIAERGGGEGARGPRNGGERNDWSSGALIQWEVVASNLDANYSYKPRMFS